MCQSRHLKPSNGSHYTWNEDPPLASVTCPCSYLLVFLCCDSPLITRLQPRRLFKLFSLFLKHTRLAPPGVLCKAVPSTPGCNLIHIPTGLAPLLTTFGGACPEVFSDQPGGSTSNPSPSRGPTLCLLLTPHSEIILCTCSLHVYFLSPPT